MARIEITIPGERIVEEFTALVPQPTTPSTAQPVNVGLVEISQSQPTQLIPGPVGPQGPRGSHWTTGDGPPASTTGYLLGDMYLDDVSGDVWTWDGTAWVNSGTNIQGSPDSGSDILTKLAPVDGSGSGLDADTLDGHDTPYFATQTDMTAVQGVNTTQDNRLTAIETKNTTQDNTLALKADIASPTFTGDPRAPTPSAADNDTSIATTAFVQTGLAAKIGDAPNDGTQYVRQSQAWAPVSVPPGTIISDTPPSPVGLLPGQFWFESDSGNTFIWYSDADSSQWVQVNVLGATTGVSYEVKTAQPYNHVVNGAMQISQENGNTAGTGAWYAADQWYQTYAGAVLPTAQRVQAVTSNGSKDRFRCTITTADAALAAGDILILLQKIEGNRIADFRWGTASARQVVLRFGFKGPAGVYSIGLVGGQSYVANFTISAGQANVDTEQTFVIPGSTTGTWVTDTAEGLSFNLTIGAGSNYVGVAGWQAGGKYATASNTNGMATAGAVFELFDVGLYLDPDNTGLAPRWQTPDYASELAACQRYYESGSTRWDGSTTSGVAYTTTGWFKALKRTVPNLSGSSTGATLFPAATGFALATTTNFVDYRTATGTGAGLFASNWTASARM
jgi:hypothetical protein